MDIGDLQGSRQDFEESMELAEGVGDAARVERLVSRFAALGWIICGAGDRVAAGVILAKCIDVCGRFSLDPEQLCPDLVMEFGPSQQ